MLPELDLNAPDEEQLPGKVANQARQGIRQEQDPNAGLFMELPGLHSRSASPSSV